MTRQQEQLKEFLAANPHTSDILDAYYGCGMCISQAARELHMHRNNVIYHIGKARDHSGLDPRKGHDCVAVQEVLETLKGRGPCSQEWLSCLDPDTLVSLGEKAYQAREWAHRSLPDRVAPKSVRIRSGNVTRVVAGDSRFWKQHPGHMGLVTYLEWKEK